MMAMVDKSEGSWLCITRGASLCILDRRPEVLLSHWTVLRGLTLSISRSEMTPKEG